MSDKPIPFSGPMVRALLDGRKTQTRRVITGRVAHDALAVFGPDFLTLPGNVDLLPIRARAGDHLWVREAWRTTPSLDAINPAQIIARSREAGYMPGWCPTHYEADDARWCWSDEDWPGLGDARGRFRQGMHMPRPLSRLTLTVTDVRVQRLQEISENDAWAEGCKRGDRTDSGGWFPADEPDPSGIGERGWDCARDWFADLWDSLNAKRGYGWDANPRVAAYTFTVHRQNIDQLEPTPCA